MNQLATTGNAELAVNQRTKDLIFRGVSDNTLKAYRRALKDLEAWMHDSENGFQIDHIGNGGESLYDGVLAAYLTELHDSGKSPATISQVTAAVDVEDVGTVLTLRPNKTDQEGDGVALDIGEPTQRVIRRYCRRARIESGALFRRIRRDGHITRVRLTVHGARDTIKRWAAEAGIEGLISEHSLLVGSVVSPTG